MKRFSKFLFGAIILSFLLLTSCKNKKQPVKPNQKFTTYINAFTSGLISNSDPVIIELMQEQNVKPGDKLDAGVFEFSPAIKGTATWQNPYTIIFKPDEKLPNGQIFEVRLHLDKITVVPDDLKTFKFGFQVKNQAIDVQTFGLEVYDNKNLKWQKLSGVLTTADFADNDKVEQCLSGVQKTLQKNITWTHDFQNKKHRFTIDSIERGNQENTLILQWDGSPVNAKNKDEKVIKIPPVDRFKLMDFSFVNEPDQIITLYFSDPVNLQQNLNGLIYFRPASSFKYSVKNNRIKIYPKQRIKRLRKLIVTHSVQNSMGKKLDQTYEKAILFKSLKPNIEAVGKGNILPDANALIFPFKAVNLKAVNVKIIKIFEKNVSQFLQVNQLNGQRELARVGRIVYKNEVALKSDKTIDYGSWNVFALDLSEMIKIEPGAIYRVEISFDKNQSLYNCPGKQSDNLTSLVQNDSNESKYEGPNAYNYYYDDYYYADYDYSQRNNPCNPSYYYDSNRKIKRNILASDFGIIAKEDGNHTMNIFVTDLITTNNVSGASVKIYDYQHNLLGEAVTDAEGSVNIKLERKGFLVVVEKDNRNGYLRIDDGSSLSLSMFDVSGQKVLKGIKAYMFGERGIWRPGDSIYLNAIVSDENKRLPENHPVILEVYNPQNQLFLRRVKTNSNHNFYDFRFATPPDAPTGNWHAKLKVGGAMFSKTLKVEAVKPNRLKINLNFKSDILHSNDLNFQLQSQWLHGAPASGLRAVVEMRLVKGKTNFKNFPDYHFDDISKSFYSESKTLIDGKLDTNGKAIVPLGISVNNAPGMLQANFKTRVFEKGGDFSIDRVKKHYSPYKSYVGVKIPEGKGWNGALYSDEPNLIPIVTVDEYGKPVNRNKLKIEVYEISWQWWWQRDSNEDLGYYLQSHNSKKILTDFISTKNGKAIYTLKFPDETWGRKYIRITDPVSGHSTGKVFYTDYKGWWKNNDGKLPGGAEMLTFSTDKKQYEIGEAVQINLPVSEQGRALISIENGSRLLENFWVDIAKDRHEFSFVTTAEMSPNVYVHISYLQAYEHTDNDRPIRLYGVQGISIINPDTHLHPVISMPDELRPESRVRIKVKEQNGKPMTYSLFVVDEGLLDLTRFKTPSPWNAFYAKEALGVKTYDMYNYVMGAFSGQIAALLAIGGDEDLIESSSKKASRFKPVVKFLGTFHLDKEQSKTHTFTMPNYVGSVRTMVVAGNLQGAYGHADKTTPVKKPLMILASLPRVLGPKERVSLPVTVFSDGKVKDAKVKITTNGILQLKSSAVQNVHFDKAGEKMVFFNMRVARKVGNAKVKVSVSGGGEKSDYTIDIPVRLPNPEITRVKDGIVAAGQTWQTDFAPFGITSTNKAVLEVSSVPPINLSKRLDYLMKYPHGCIEQTTSSVFPQLYLPDLVDLTNTQKAEIQDNIIAGIERLKNFQLTNGGFTYWPGESAYADDWGTNYAGHFLLEAKSKGYAIPGNMLQEWITYQKRRADDWSTNKNGSTSAGRSQQMMQAYRLYTLALAGKPELGAMNRLRETTNLYPAAQWQLIAAYNLAGKSSVARQMMQNLTTQVAKYQELAYTYGNSHRDEAIILRTLVQLNEMAKARTLLNQITADLSSDQWFSTQTVAYELLAVSSFVEKGKNGPMKFELTLNGKRKSYKSNKTFIQLPVNYRSSGASVVALNNETKQTLFVKLYNTGKPLESDNLASAENLIMNINYYNVSGQAIDVSQIKQGTDFVIEVIVKHPGILKDYQNMALTQIFPSGWEITNSRLDNISHWKSDTFTYQDIRDDRVMTYFDLKRGQTKTFRLMANASYTGKYYLPSVKCEAMYDHNIMAVTNGKWVVINQ